MRKHFPGFKSPEFERWMREERPVLLQSRRDFDEARKRRDARVFRAMEEQKALTMAASMPDDERRQEILTPSQQLAMRDEVARCKSVPAAVRIINKHIFGGDDGLVDKIDTNPAMQDAYKLDYAVTNWG